MPSGMTEATGRRSDAWFHDPDMYGFVRRAFAKSMGLDDADLARPIIGIAQTQSDLNNCNNNFRELADYVGRGVWQARRYASEFPTISLGELCMRPTTMLYRNLMAMDTEEMIRAHPLDGVVLLGNCDKTTPAQMMGAASANIPSIMLTGGPHLSGRFRGESLGACSDCRRFWAEYRAGTIDADAMAELEEGINRSDGHCTVMGTASTMAAMAEALGLALPGTAAIPAPDARRLRLAEAAGRQIVATVQAGIRPSDVLTPRAFENAIRLMMALGGSTNAVIHLTAIAGRRGIHIAARSVRPHLARDAVHHQPAAERDIPHGAAVRRRRRAGGDERAGARRPAAPGRTQHHRPHHRRATGVGGTARHRRQHRHRVVRTRADRVSAGAATRPAGRHRHPARQPRTGWSGGEADRRLTRLMRHRGQAIVFSSTTDLAARIDDPDLDVTPASVLVLQNTGPKGAPGMPEAGGLPIPKKLLAQGVRDMLRISDARMSGTGYGAVVLHVAPEAAVGGPLGLVQTGDWIDRRSRTPAPPGSSRRRARPPPSQPGTLPLAYAKPAATRACTSTTSPRPTQVRTSTSSWAETESLNNVPRVGEPALGSVMTRTTSGQGDHANGRANASAPMFSCMRRSWLYLDKRSELAREPIFIWPAAVATARSAMKGSSVSPERAETIGR